MNKKEIIELAESFGFHLDYDQYEISGKEYMRFRLNDKELDESSLIWTWYSDNNDSYNIIEGHHIAGRAQRKREILNFNKY